jgi:hypothetical protein
MDVGNGTLYMPNFIPYIYDLTLPNATAIANDIFARNITIVFMSLVTSSNLSTILGNAGVVLAHFPTFSTFFLVDSGFYCDWC